MTLGELKAVVAGMTPGIVRVVAIPSMDSCRHVENVDPVTGYSGPFAAWMRPDDARGITAIRNHISELIARLEQATEALNAVQRHLLTTFPPYAPGCSPFDKVRSALATLTKPLGATS